MHRPLQFAVVREDARTLLAVLAQSRARRPLIVASGGCTALAVAARAPGVELVALDPNPAQIQHVRAKESALAHVRTSGDRRAFNVGSTAVHGLGECGNFEALFRQWRAFVDEFVVAPAVRAEMFRDAEHLDRGRTALFESRWWRTSFEVFFSDALLEAMFGPAATQHALRGSYPGWFQRAFERGLTRPDALTNPFVHHLFLGAFLDRPKCLPDFLAQPTPAAPLRLVESSFEDYADLREHDLVDLSNVLDWMPQAAVRDLLERCAGTLQPGAVVLWRQLNNDRDLESLTRGALRFDHDLAAQLHAADRSLFYSSLHIGTRA